VGGVERREMIKMKTLLGVYGFMILVVLLIGGLVGMLCWPYTINTWGEYLGGDEFEPIGAGTGFWLGVIPIIGKFSIIAAGITLVCDLVFIPDGKGACK
jgi:hypothetical protein